METGKTAIPSGKSERLCKSGKSGSGKQKNDGAAVELFVSSWSQRFDLAIVKLSSHLKFWFFLF